MTYVQQYDAANEPESNLFKQLTAAIIKAAADVRAEDPGTANHANRLIWAKVVINHNNAKTEAALRLWEIQTNATIAADPITAFDTDVQFVCNSFIDSWANET